MDKIRNNGRRDDRTNERTNGRTDGRTTVRPSLRWSLTLSASSSNKTDTFNIWCKSCRKWQSLYGITETINTPIVVNFLECDVTEVLFSVVAFKTVW